MKPYSSDGIKVKIECFIDAALKKEMSWAILASVIDNMTPTLYKSKEVIKILLDIMEEKLGLTYEVVEDVEPIVEVDLNQDVIEMEDEAEKHIKDSTIEDENCQVKEESIERSLKRNEDSQIGLENHSQSEEVLLESKVDVSTEIQVVESLKDQFFVFIGYGPDKKQETEVIKESHNPEKLPIKFK